MLYEYECRDCFHSFALACSINERHNQACERCGGKADKLLGNLSVVGTRDNFGIKKIFRDDSTNQEIDTWKKWEKAGYRNPMETIKNPKVRENVQRKIKRIKG